MIAVRILDLGRARFVTLLPERDVGSLPRPLHIVEAERLGVVVRAALFEARDDGDREAEGVARLVVAVSAEDFWRAVHRRAVEKV